MRHAPSRPCAVCGAPARLAGRPSRPLDILPPGLPILTLIFNRHLLKYLHTVSKFGFCNFNLDICSNTFIWKIWKMLAEWTVTHETCIQLAFCTDFATITHKIAKDNAYRLLSSCL